VADVAMRDVDGVPISTASLKGKVVIINFWATWCPPCRAEIPDLIKLQSKYKDQLQIIGISDDDDPPATVKKWAAEHRMNYPIVMSTDDLRKAFSGVAALPTSFIIDRDSRLVMRHVGMLMSATTEAETRHLAGLPVPAADRNDRRADLLAVGADVLDRGRAGQPWNAGQALQARQPAGDGPAHHAVPVLARRDPHRCRPIRAAAHLGDAAGADPHDRAVESLVGDDQVAAAAQDQDRLAPAVGGAHRGDHVRVGGRLGEPRRRAAQAQGGAAGERHLLADDHRSPIPPPARRHRWTGPA